MYTLYHYTNLIPYWNLAFRSPWSVYWIKRLYRMSERYACLSSIL